MLRIHFTDSSPNEAPADRGGAGRCDISESQGSAVQMIRSLMTAMISRPYRPERQAAAALTEPAQARNMERGRTAKFRPQP